MATENIRLRNEFINTQVITRNSGKRLGVIKELLVDIDRREVMALGLRDSALSVSGMPKYMYLNSIINSGDVVLVEDEDVIEDIDSEAYNKLVNCEVITETGEPLGRVRDFQFDVTEGRVCSLIIASVGLPQIPDQLISTYEIPIDEVVSSGPNRLIVFEGAEERITQLTVGLLERLGIGRPPWEREEEEMYYPPTVRPENQLGTGIPVRTPVVTPVKEAPPIQEAAWDEDDDWRETSAQRPPARQMEAIPYDDYDENLEEDNWGESRVNKNYQSASYSNPSRPKRYDRPADHDINEDVWDDESEESYNPPRINIPEVQKRPEYEEEINY
jgi:sporulation protein YlmC with PRC-barrel domain